MLEGPWDGGSPDDGGGGTVTAVCGCVRPGPTPLPRSGKRGQRGPDDSVPNRDLDPAHSLGMEAHGLRPRSLRDQLVGCWRRGWGRVRSAGMSSLGLCDRQGGAGPGGSRSEAGRRAGEGRGPGCTTQLPCSGAPLSSEMAPGLWQRAAGGQLRGVGPWPPEGHSACHSPSKLRADFPDASLVSWAGPPGASG